MPLARKVSGKRFGIFGLGRIGLAVARRLAAFDGQIRYTSREAKDVPYGFEPDLLRLAAGSDVLVICAAASASTKHVVDRAVARCPGAGRRAGEHRPRLHRGRSGAGGGRCRRARWEAPPLDVFADEPHVPAALMAMDNVLLTPHIASATDETRRAMGQLMLDNLEAFFAGKPLLTPVV